MAGVRLLRGFAKSAFLLSGLILLLASNASAQFVAEFSANPTSGCIPVTVSFTDQSTGTPTTWSWDFGDGGSSNEQNPSHTYVAANTYTVTLTVEDGVAQDAETKTALITVLTPVTAAFGSDETSGCGPLSVNFSDLSSGDGVNSWAWDFGDGNSSTEQNPNHTYQNAGTYAVVLTARNDCSSDTEAKTDFITVGTLPTAEFNSSPPSVCIGGSVSFTKTSTGNETWSWNFGDGGSSNLQNPDHTYQSAGTFTVNLTVTGDCGQASVTKVNLITVTAPGAADFQASPPSGCPDLIVNFTDTSTGSGLEARSWNFGDGSSGEGLTPSHTYTTTGTFTVSLTVTAQCGELVATKTELITVLEPTAAAFDESNTSGCAPLTVNFTDRSTDADLSSRSWLFGDGDSSIEQNPQHTYQNAGTYTVTLTVGGTCGQSSAMQLIEVADAPVAPLNIQYRTTGVFLDETLPISWPASEGAAEYVVEAQVDNSVWSRICTVDDDPGLQEVSCSVQPDERGTWTFRVFSQNDCGKSSPVTGPGILVVPRQIFADWRLDCPNAGIVPDSSENDNDGQVIGNVPCDDDRFFDRNDAALRFDGEGYVHGSSLRPWDDAFSISLWTRPEATPPGEGGESTLFEIFADDAAVTPQTETLSIVWNSEEVSLLVKRGVVEMFRFTNVAPDAWHHVLVTRTGQTLQAYLDGVPAPPVTHGFHLGDGFSMGAAGNGSSRFLGHLDEILYESDGRSRTQAVDLLLERNGSVYLDPTVPAQEVSLPPGGMVEAMALRLRTGQPDQTQFRIESLKLRLVDVTPPEQLPGGAGIGDDEDFSYLESITLFSRSQCTGQDIDLEEIGTFEVQPVAPGTADLELILTTTTGRPFIIPFNNDANCFSVQVALSAVDLTPNRALQFGLESTDDLIVLDGNQETFVAGRRRAEGLSVPGNEVHVVNTPKLLVKASSTPREEETDQILHDIELEAGSTESIKVNGIIYRQLPGRTLMGVKDAVLFVTQGAEESFVGIVDIPSGEIRFTNLGVEIPASESAEFFLLANTESPPDDAGTVIMVWPSPKSLPPGLLAVLLIGIPLTLLSLLRPKNTLRLARLATLCVLGGLLSFGSGCGPLLIGGLIAGLSAGGGGGGGGGGSALVQVGILNEGDLDARGATSNAPAMLDVDDPNLVGPAIQVQ